MDPFRRRVIDLPAGGGHTFLHHAPLLAPLLPAEVATVELETGRGPARLRDFEAGRQCAELAAAQLGHRGARIGIAADRRPQWPPGLTGSITHTDGFAAAALGPTDRFQAIGIDVERTGSVGSELWPRIMRPSELAHLAGVPAQLRASMATVVFSAKEAFYKAQFEVVQQWLEFHDVTVGFASPTGASGTLTVMPAPGLRLFRDGRGPVTIRYAFDPERVATALVLPAA